jgi:hypothetical protein
VPNAAQTQDLRIGRERFADEPQKKWEVARRKRQAARYQADELTTKRPGKIVIGRERERWEGGEERERERGKKRRGER